MIAMISWRDKEGIPMPIELDEAVEEGHWPTKLTGGFLGIPNLEMSHIFWLKLRPDARSYEGVRTGLNNGFHLTRKENF